MVFQQPAAICADRFLKRAGKCLWEGLQVWLCLQTSGLVTHPVSKVRETSAAQVGRQEQEGQVQSQVCGVMQIPWRWWGRRGGSIRELSSFAQ